MVSDNASVMLSSLRKLFESTPLVIHACCAHWLQLLLSDASEVGIVEKAFAFCSSIRRAFHVRVDVF